MISKQVIPFPLLINQYATRSADLAAKLLFLQRTLREPPPRDDPLPQEIANELGALEQEVSALLEQLRPYRIAIAGAIASGKSTFLNEALVGTRDDEFLRTGDGRTTELPLELQYRGDSDSYRVMVEFVEMSSLQLLLKLLGRWELRREREENPDLDQSEVNKIHASRSRLNMLFSNVEQVLGQIRTLGESDVEVPALVLRENEATACIGGPARVVEVGSMEGAREVIAQYSNEPWIWAVQSIRVEGPFEFIPAGVVVVDTPGLGDESVVISERTEAQLSAADEVWHLTPSAQLFAERTAHLAVVQSLTEGGASRTVRVVVTKCRGGRKPLPKDARIKTMRDNLIAAHRRGIPEESMTNDERREWTERRRPAIEKRVNAIPVAFTEFTDPYEGVDTVHGWLRDLFTERSQRLDTLEIAFHWIVGRMEGLYTQTIPAPCTADELATWYSNVGNAHGQLTAAMNALASNMSDDSYHRMIALNRWAIDPASHMKNNRVQWKTGVSTMSNYGHHITRHGTQYNLTADIVNRYLDYMQHVRSCVMALQAAALALPANDARFAAALETLRTEFNNIEYSLFGAGTWNWHTSTLRPLYENYARRPSWSYFPRSWYGQQGQTNDSQNVYFFQSQDIDFASTYRWWVQQHVTQIGTQLQSLYSRLVTTVQVVAPLPARYRQAMVQMRNVTASTLTAAAASAAANDVCPISLAPFTDPVSLSCGHYFDRPSLEGTIRVKGDAVCPICRQVRIGVPWTWQPRPDVLLRCILSNPVAAPTADWAETMTASVVEELRREESGPLSAAGESLGQLTAAVDRLVLGPVAAPPPPVVFGPAPGPTPVPVPVPVPFPAPDTFPRPSPAATANPTSVPPPQWPRK